MRNFTAYIVFFCLFVLTLEGFGQNPDAQRPTRERLQAQKIAFITQHLALTPNEAQQFWPVYNEFDAKRLKYHAAANKALKKINDADNLSDKELDELANEFLTNQLQDAQLQVEYHEKFKKILPIKKVVKLYSAEKKFRNMLLKKLGNQQDLLEE